MRPALLVAAAAITIAWVVMLGCYAHGPNPPPCDNIETCDNPADVPPLTIQAAPKSQDPCTLYLVSHQPDLERHLWRYHARIVCECPVDGQLFRYPQQAGQCPVHHEQLVPLTHYGGTP